MNKKALTFAWLFGKICTQSYDAELEEVMRENIILACTECKNRNYNTQKNKKNNPERIEFSKYCPFCKKHTAHKETK